MPSCCEHHVDKERPRLFAASRGVTPWWVRRVVVFSGQPDLVGTQIMFTGLRITLLLQAVLAVSDNHPRARDRWRKTLSTAAKRYKARTPSLRSRRRVGEAAAGSSAYGRRSAWLIFSRKSPRCRLANSSYSIYDPHKKYLWFTDNWRTSSTSSLEPIRPKRQISARWRPSAGGALREKEHHERPGSHLFPLVALLNPARVCQQKNPSYVSQRMRQFFT